MDNNSKYYAWAITIAAAFVGYALWKRGGSSNPPSLINDPNLDMSTNPNLPRGYRNNNPLNIRYVAGNNWKGKVYPNTDRNNTFEQFVNIGTVAAQFSCKPTDGSFLSFKFCFYQTANVQLVVRLLI